MHAHHTALSVSVPGRLQFIEACFECLAVHHVLIVCVSIFDGFVNGAANETISYFVYATLSNMLTVGKESTMFTLKHHQSTFQILDRRSRL